MLDSLTRAVRVIEIEKVESIDVRYNVLVTETKGYIDNLHGREPAIRVLIEGPLGTVDYEPISLSKKMCRSEQDDL